MDIFISVSTIRPNMPFSERLLVIVGSTHAEQTNSNRQGLGPDPGLESAWTSVQKGAAAVQLNAPEHGHC